MAEYKLSYTGSEINEKLKQIEELQNIEVGGRNYIPNSTGNYGINKWNAYPNITISTNEDGMFGNNSIVVTSASDATSRGAMYQHINRAIKKEDLGAYTLSFWYKADPTNISSGVGSGVQIENYYTTTTSQTKIQDDMYFDSTGQLILDGEWHYYSSTENITMADGANTISSFIRFHAYQGNVYYSCIKFEKGNKATDWTPNHEDIEGKEVSHIGMIIHSTTLDTMQKVIDIYGGTTWEKIEGMFLLGQSSAYAINSTGGEASHTLSADEMPSHTHSVGAHSHGLNSHTHSVGAHSHGLNGHTHSIPALSGTAASNGSHKHSVPHNADATTGGSKSRMFGYSGDGTTDAKYTNRYTETTGAHTHSVTTNASTTGGASGSTANSTAFNTGAASGNTANSTAFDSGSAGSGTAHNNMPPYKTVYIWERTA